jgi:hypothetical protein
MRLHRLQLQHQAGHALGQGVVQFPRHALAFRLEGERRVLRGVGGELRVGALQRLGELLRLLALGQLLVEEHQGLVKE